MTDSSREQPNKQVKRKWTATEDNALICCLVDLKNLRTYIADNGFKSGYLLELEKMLANKLPNSGMKARPHIESRLKTLKKDWGIVYDMMYGPHTSGFGWDENRKMVIAEDEVWDAYILSHKDAAPFRVRSFPNFEYLSLVFAKDRATGKDAQGVEEILQEYETEETVNEVQSEDNNLNDSGYGNANTSMPEDVFRTFVTDTTRTSTSHGKKRKNSNNDLAQSVDNIANVLKEEMREMSEKLSKSMTSDIIQEKLAQIPAALRAIEGLTTQERHKAIVTFTEDPNKVIVFFGSEPEERLELVKVFLGVD